MGGEAKVLLDGYELTKEVLPAIARFPRTHRYSLGERIEGRLFDLLGFLEEARFSRERARTLAQADARLRQVGTFLRLACDLRLMSQGQYGQLCERIATIGQQIGGWLRYAQNRSKGDGPV